MQANGTYCAFVVASYLNVKRSVSIGKTIIVRLDLGYGFCLLKLDSLLNIVEACGVSYDISRNATVIPVITNHQMNLTTVCIRCVLDETGLTSIHPEAVHYSSNGYPINSSTGDLSVVDNKLIINHPTRILTDQQTLECYMNVSLLKHFIVFSFQGLIH